jgi:hypothetical protein
MKTAGMTKQANPDLFVEFFERIVGWRKMSYSLLCLTVRHATHHLPSLVRVHDFREEEDHD